jgi:hypothetical protein
MSDRPPVTTPPAEYPPDETRPPNPAQPVDPGGEIIFAVYNTATGEILRTGSSNVTDVDSQAGAGETVIHPVSAEVKGSTHYYNGAGIVMRPYLPTIPENPSTPFIIDMENVSAVQAVNQGGFVGYTNKDLDPIRLTDAGWYEITRLADFPYQSDVTEINAT